MFLFHLLFKVVKFSRLCTVLFSNEQQSILRLIFKITQCIAYKGMAYDEQFFKYDSRK